MNSKQMASATNPIVQYHDGGLLFAGDPQEYDAGWYLFDGKGARPVTVIPDMYAEEEVVDGPSHKWVYQDIPVGQSKWDWWDKQPAAVLDAATNKVLDRGADPWVFGLDARGFHQFSGNAERSALLAMTDEERTALLGEWEKEDYDTFEFEPSRQVTAEEGKGIAEVKALG